MNFFNFAVFFFILQKKCLTIAKLYGILISINTKGINGMECEYSISLDRIIKEFQLEVIHLPRPAEEIKISNTEVNRPGLALAGFFSP